MRRPQGIPRRHIKLKLFGKSGSDFLNFVDKTKTLTTEKQIMMTPAAYASNRSSGGKKKKKGMGRKMAIIKGRKGDVSTGSRTEVTEGRGGRGTRELLFDGYGIRAGDD